MSFFSALFAKHTVHHLTVGVLHAAHVAAEAVLVELFVCLEIPETAGVRGNLIGEDERAVGQTPKLELEVDQTHAEGAEVFGQHLVDAESHGLDRLDLLAGRELQGNRVIGVEQGIVQIVVLVGELDGGLVKNDPLLHAVALFTAVSRSFSS